MFLQCYPIVKGLSSYNTCSSWPKKMFRFSQIAWRVSKTHHRTSTFELTGRNFKFNVFTKGRPLFLLPDKSAFPFVGKMKGKYKNKTDSSLTLRQAIYLNLFRCLRFFTTYHFEYLREYFFINVQNLNPILVQFISQLVFIVFMKVFFTILTVQTWIIKGCTYN